MCFAVATSICVIVIAAVTASILSELVVDVDARAFEAQSTHLIVLAGALLLRVALHYARERYAQRAADLVIADLRGQATDVLSDPRRTAPRRLLEVRDHAVTVILRGLDDLAPYLSGYVPALILSTVITPVMVVVIAIVDLPSAIIVFITLPLIPVFMVLIGVMTRDRTAAKLAATSQLSGQLMDLVAGLPTLRALHRVHRPTRQVTELGQRWQRSTMATLRIAFLSGAVLELLATLCVALVAVGIGVRLVYGEMSLFAGVFALILAPEVYLPLRQVGAQFHNSTDGLAAADDVFELIGDETATASGVSRVDLRGADLEFDALSVDGRDGPAPDRLSSVIPGGSLTLWRGPNGIGKSTALSVLLGLVDGYSGTVTVSGQSIGDLDLDHFRSQIAWLPQHPAILPATVADNLELFGNPTSSDLEQAMAATGFDAVVQQLPQGVRTRLGAGGVGLSAGQRQRLGLSRVLASPAPLLLLDEPTAHLDDDSADAVVAAVRSRVERGATVVVISHRESWWAAADHLVEFGSVELGSVETGNAHASAR
ncbi:ABC transporter permease/ATP-binding protein CydD [Gordonia effusa NBRC 100432]|uniref:ABC transporter permease/ATP-binding protein CydD n=1 Tax=Gordonia effusa NBRC 100432 TaxID=1077974 RepID=H0R4E3_9ACTN|nr:ABC transporter permease/ATP-binding protein CydD [Gordonia effusa NBRC 100432]